MGNEEVGKLAERFSMGYIVGVEGGEESEKNVNNGCLVKESRPEDGVHLTSRCRDSLQA